MSVAGDIQNLEKRLGESGFQLEQEQDEKADESQVLVARRSDFSWSWAATRLHTFVVVFSEVELTTRRAEELSAAAQELAIRQKGGLPRGLQNGTATFATFVCRRPSAELTQWFASQPEHRYAALKLPVLADLDARQLTWVSGRLKRGFIYQEHFRHIVRDVLAPGLNCATPR